MKSVSASELRSGLSRILDSVERGEAVKVTRRGRSIAVITPVMRKRWKMRGLRLKVPGAGLTELILEERQRD